MIKQLKRVEEDFKSIVKKNVSIKCTNQCVPWKRTT